MPNWKLTDKRIYKLLKHPFQIDQTIVGDMTSAYLEFVEDLLDYLNKVADNKLRIRKSLFKFH